MSTSTLADHLVPIAEGAEIAGINPRTLRKYALEGRIPMYTIGHKRKLYVDRRDLDSLLTPVAESEDNYRASIRRLVDAAPPLTAEQRDRIAAILGGSGR